MVSKRVVQWLSLLATLVFGLLSSPWGETWNPTLAVLAGLCLVLFLGLLFVRQLPPWTVLFNASRVTIDDPSGASARFKKELTLRSNHRGQSRYLLRNMSYSGAVQPLGCKSRHKLTVRTDGGRDHINIDFPHDVTPFSSIDHWCTFELNGSFTNREEFVALEIDQPTREILIEVDLPSSRPPQDVWAVHRYSGEERPLEDPELSETTIRWSAKRFGPRSLRYGEYWVYWRW